MIKLLAVILLWFLFICPAFAGGTSGTGTGTSLTGSSGSSNVSNATGTLPIANAGLDTSSTQPNTQSIVRLYNGTAGTYKSQNNYVYNADPILLPNFSKCLAKVQANQGNCRVFMVGDSTTYGVFSNGGSTGNLTAAAPAADLAAIFQAQGISATYNAWWGNNGISSAVTYTNDGRITTGTGWGTNAGSFIGPAGTFIQGVTPGQLLTFTPTTPTDTCKVWYGSTSSTQTIQLDVNGNNSTTKSTTATTGSGSLQVTSTGGVGMNPCNIQVASGSNLIYVEGIEAWDSTKSAIIFESGGWSGATSFNLGQTSGHLWGFADGGLTGPAFDLITIGFGINEWDNFAAGNVAYSPTLTNGYMQSLITPAKASGADVLLVTDIPSNPASFGATPSIQISFINQWYALANTNNIPLIDAFDLFQSYAISQPLGLYGDAFTHPNQIGYQKIVGLEAGTLLATAKNNGGQNPIPFGSNANGYNNNIYSGVSTGTGTSGLNFYTYLAGSTGSVQNSPTNVLSISNTGHLSFAGNVPAVTSCGSGTLVAGSTDSKGQITGISAATACTITFSRALPTAPSCAFTTSTGIAAGGIPTTSAVTTSMALFTGTLGYICF